MSSFLIVPRNVYGQLKCCTASGVSDAVPSPDTLGNEFGTNYVAQSIGTPLNWQISDGIDKEGGVGFAVCCGLKEFTITYTCWADLSYITAETGNVIFTVGGTFGVIPDEIRFLVSLDPNGFGYEVVILENGIVAHITVVQTLEAILYVFIRTASITATACQGSVVSQARIDASSGTIVPATVTAQFSIT